MQGNAITSDLASHIELIQKVSNVIIVFINSFDVSENLSALVKLLGQYKSKVCVIYSAKNEGEDSDDDSDDDDDEEEYLSHGFKLIKFSSDTQSEAVSEIRDFTSKCLKLPNPPTHTFLSIAEHMQQFDVDLNSDSLKKLTLVKVFFWKIRNVF